MKKIIGLSLFTVLAMVSCKKNESAEQLKIDSTQVAAQQAPVVSETSIIEETKKQPETSLALSEPSFDFGKIDGKYQIASKDLETFDKTTF